jgi:hypothetical protein
VLHELEILLGKERVALWIDVEQVLEAHEECIGGVYGEFQFHSWLQARFNLHRLTLRSPSDPTVPNASRPVFGALLSETTHYASCSTVLGGRPHNLPLVVFAAVEELYRAGKSRPLP